MTFEASSTPTPEPSNADSSPAPDALELLKRTNDFLALCVAQSESALETEDPAQLISALRTIRDSAGGVAGAGESLRRDLLEPGDDAAGD